jgi:hypothetical protein
VHDTHEAELRSLEADEHRGLLAFEQRLHRGEIIRETQQRRRDRVAARLRYRRLSRRA